VTAQQQQTHPRFSQQPLAWRTPLEPLSTVSRRPGVPYSLRYSSASARGEEEAVEDLLSPAEELETEPEERPLRTSDRPIYEGNVVNNTMYGRANPAWDTNRWRGAGDDLSPLMCIRFVGFCHFSWP
jgi:hypothetical protein